MSYHIEFSGTYVGGVLRPDKDLGLPDGARVRFTLHSQQPTSESRRLALEKLDRIRHNRLIRLAPGRLTRDDLHDRR